MMAPADAWRAHGFAGTASDLVAAGTLPRAWAARWAGAPRAPTLAGPDGRWFALRESGEVPHEVAVETLAWTLLHRYGVVFRRVLARETPGVPWRELVSVYRRLEGEKAFYRLLGERSGRFAFSPGEPSTVRRLTAPTSQLLMDAMRQVDEVSHRRRSSEHLGSLA